MAAGATRPRPVASSVPAAEAPPLPELSEERKMDLAELLRAPQPDDAATVELLLNPTPDSAGAVTAMMETARAGPPRYDCFISTGVAPAFAFSAFRHRNAEGGFQYDVRLTPTESSRVGTNSFCAQLKCSADCTRYTLCDDPSNFYSYPRELGAVFVGGAGLGNRISVLVPRVLPSGAAAQFRVLRPEDGIISRFLAGQAREHIMTLSGLWTSKEGGTVELTLGGEGTAASQRRTVFRATQSSSTLSLQYSSPLSCFQAFCIALSLVHHAQHRRRPSSEPRRAYGSVGRSSSRQKEQEPPHKPRPSTFPRAWSAKRGEAHAPPAADQLHHNA